MVLHHSIAHLVVTANKFHLITHKLSLQTLCNISYWNTYACNASFQPRIFGNFVFVSAEYIGRRAGRGNSAVVQGITRGFCAMMPVSCATVKISCANSYHEIPRELSV